MNLEPAPRLNKIPFFFAAGVCVAAVIAIGLLAPDKFAPVYFLSSVGLVFLSIVIVMIPLLADFAAANREYVQSEQRRIADQVARLQDATEHLARATAQIKSVEEAVNKSAHSAENLPYRMQEKLAEFNEALAAKDSEEREQLERENEELRAGNADTLKGLADKIARTSGEWTALEAASRKQLTATQDAVAKLQDKLQASLAQFDARLAEWKKLSATPVATLPTPAPAPVPVSEPSPAPVTARVIEAPAVPVSVPSETPAAEEPVAPIIAVAPIAAAAPSPIESVTLVEKPATLTDEGRPKKARVIKKPKPEELLAQMSLDPAITQDEPALAGGDEPATRAVLESSASSDGATRLLVTAYIGIGNKLYLRGEGQGLSWEKGVPMQFVSIGKWGWASHDVTIPLKCRLYKNDEAVALSGEVTLEPGKHVELTALF